MCANKIIEQGIQNGKATGKSELPAQRKSKERKKHYEPVIFRAWCKSCGICSAFCPENVISNDNMGAPVIERPDDCIGCRFCELHCPDFAIMIRECKPETSRIQS